MRPLSALSLLPLASIVVAADPAHVRFDVDAMKDGITLADPALIEGIKGKAENPSWVKDGLPHWVSATITVQTGTWTKVGVTFTPSKDGKAVLRLGGPHRFKPGQDDVPAKERQKQPVPVLWDAVTVSGATFPGNGGFETMDAKKPAFPAGWWFQRPDYTVGGVVSEPGRPFEGKQAVKAWHDEPVFTHLTLTAGQTVTITAMAWTDVALPKPAAKPVAKPADKPAEAAPKK